MSYVPPIWIPSLSERQWGDLQVKQIAALRMETGCHVMASVPHLHHDTRLMMVKARNELLSIQFLLEAFKEGCADHWTTQPPLPMSRQVSSTLLAQFSNMLLEHVNEDTLKDLDEPVYRPVYRAALAQIYPDLPAKAPSSDTTPIW